MFILYIIPLLLVCVSTSVFDQRQTGDLNVQVDIKDVQIFALMKGNKEEYVDYDYAYDYSEFTIKPQNRTTPKPFNHTSTSTEQTNVNNSTLNLMLFQDNTTASEDATTATTITSSYDDFITTIKDVSESTTQASQAKKVTVKPISTSTTTIKNCRKGFVLNQKGDCQLRLNSTGNALMKLVKLSQKLKLRRENREQSHDNS